MNKNKKTKVLAIANQKGGVGKTAIAVHIAFGLANAGYKVLVIDLDTQANASYTLAKHKCNVVASSLFNNTTALDIADKFSDENINLIIADDEIADLSSANLQKVGNFHASVAAIADTGKFDLIICDTAPSLGVTMTAALLASDYVISPIELEIYALQGVGKMLSVIENVRKINQKLEFLGILPSKVDARNPRHKRHLQQIQELYQDNITPCTIGLRSSIAEALAQAMPVWDIKKTSARKAAQEMRQLTQFIQEKIGI